MLLIVHIVRKFNISYSRSRSIAYHRNTIYWYIFIAAESDQATSGFYAKPVSIGDFTKHCQQRRKYPVLLKLEFNNAIKEREIQPSRHGTRKVNIEKNQNPRVVPCKYYHEMITVFSCVP